MGKSQITSLPLENADKAEFIEAANQVFESILNRIEPQNPKAIRERWDAVYYIDNILLQENMLPIDRNYAMSLIEALLVHHILGLAAQAEPPTDENTVKEIMNDPELLEELVSSFEMDDDDPNLKPGLICEVKLDCDNDAMAVWALRSIAMQIEQDGLDSGFHPINTPNGKKVGEVYLDHYYENTP